jgi:hypothetical protein
MGHQLLQTKWCLGRKDILLSSDDRAPEKVDEKEVLTRSCGGYYPLTRNEEQKTLC